MQKLKIEEIVEAGVKLTPMMEQYYAIKKNYPDTFLLFRMGDFYEVFFEDAINAAKVLNIAQTHRGKLGDYPIPMAGIPHHAANAYIDRLTSQGYKAAICEQVQDPKEAKGIVERAVTQVVSPAMPYDLEKASSEQRYIASAYRADHDYFLVLIDFTTGDFEGRKLNSCEELVNQIRLAGPTEFISFMGQWDDEPVIDDTIDAMGVVKTYLSEEYFDAKFTGVYTEKFIPTYKDDQIIGNNKQILSCIGAVSYYICTTQHTEELIHIRPFRMVNDRGHMRVTLPTLTGLEILPKSKERYKESLLGFFDKTKTAMGMRHLRHVFTNPLLEKKDIHKRQAFIESMLEHDNILIETRELLQNIRDIERILAKTSTGKVNSSDLINLSIAIEMKKDLEKLLKKIPQDILASTTTKETKELQLLSDRIKNTLNDDIGASLEKGNLIKDGADKKRDKLAKLANGAKDELLKLDERYREETGIPKLRVKANNVAGHFIEVSKSHSSKVPAHFVRKQTLVNSERFMTEELAEFEKEMITAKENLARLERQIFKDLIANVIETRTLIMKLVHYYAPLDVFQSFAWVARQEDFIKPTFKNEKIINIKGAWHPLIRKQLQEQFVPHDIILNDDAYFGLITGPNMAGKTTVMREVAIIQLLGQIGSFVPATEVTIGLCDYLFSRLGASDDILNGRSTFMVEMSETAEILRHATEKSLIILDEVGRGTSTYDGLSIAWALVEHFVNETKALGLFATHYHELIEVVESLKGAKNFTVETINDNGNVRFLYRLIEQGASQSFGIHVAELAGVPTAILQRSKWLLNDLEASEKEIPERAPESSQQLSFFDINRNPEEERSNDPIIKELRSIDVMKMTPLEAMTKLHDLTTQLEQ